MNTTPTADNRGLLPIGTDTRFGTIVDVSLTAYEVAMDDGDGRVYDTRWISFDQVHGRPRPVAPLITFG